MQQPDQIPNRSGWTGFLKLMLMLFVSVEALLAILLVANALTLDTFKSYSIKLLLIAFIILVAGALISLALRTGKH